jgi:hypothetical protein
VKEFGVEVKAGEPKFSGFRLQKNFLFEQKIFKRGFKRRFQRERAKVGKGFLNMIKLSYGEFDPSLNFPKMKVIPPLQRLFGVQQLSDHTLSRRA